MILAIDVGNTNIVLGIIDDGNIVDSVRINTVASSTADEYAIKLNDLLVFMKADFKKIDGAIISTVVPQLIISLSVAIEKLLGITPVVVSDKIKLGINFTIDDPSSVAGDLIVGAEAALAYYSAPIIVIDLGTATTITVLDKDGSFSGGLIFPGVNLGLSALSTKTALLPSISLDKPEKAIGTNTIDCMRSGAVFCTADLIDGAIERFEKELGYKCIYLATGGLASSIVSNCRHNIICDNDLLLKGLWKIYELNSKKE